MVDEAKRPKWDMTFKGNFPATMRRMVWPLCCGFSIISGFKSVNVLTDEELLDHLNYICGPSSPRLDFQVFAGENMKPKMTFLTLNNAQMKSKKITEAVEKAGFFLVGIGKPRGLSQGLYLRDDSKTWKPSGHKPNRRKTEKKGEPTAA